MADAYFDYTTGSSGNSGLTSALPKATRDQAVTVAGAGDTVWALDGDQTHESGHFIFDDARIESALSFRGATLKANAAETSQAARTSGSLTAANNPWRCVNYVIDGSSGNGSMAQAFDIVQDAAEDITTQFHGIHFISGASYGLRISNRRGRIELVNAKITGQPSVAAFGGTVSLSGDGNQVIDVQGLELDVSLSSGTLTGVQITKINNTTNTLTVQIKGVRGTVRTTGTGSAVGMNIKSVNPVITGSDLIIDSLQSSGTGHYGILVQGQSAAACSLPIIAANSIDFRADAGYAIAVGISSVASYVTSGEVSGNYIKGRYYYDKTPHGIVAGNGVNGATIRGNVIQDIYAPYLASLCTAVTFESNVAFDCYGTAYYAKGNTAATFRNNVAILQKWAAPTGNRGVLSVAPQTGTDSAGATFQENLVIVSDMSKCPALAYIEDANQVCSFVRNTYIIPDTVDLSSALLFQYKAGADQAANYTYAQWLAESEVTDDIIIQLPTSEINKLISSYKPIKHKVISNGIIKNAISR